MKMEIEIVKEILTEKLNSTSREALPDWELFDYEEFDIAFHLELLEEAELIVGGVEFDDDENYEFTPYRFTVNGQGLACILDNKKMYSSIIKRIKKAAGVWTIKHLEKMADSLLYFELDRATPILGLSKSQIAGRIHVSK